jgi:UDP-2-acetamido-3-amino-2,3-dideoxy-glucuronate N-acetyltransferase
MEEKIILSELGVAIAGCGGWGKNLARNLQKLGVLKVIIDPSEKAKMLAIEMAVDIVDDLETVLADDAIAAVVIATPAGTHFALAKRCILAGKDVFVEKPIALNVSEAEQLKALADNTGKILMVGHLLQYHPVFIKLIAMVRAGDLGKIHYVSSSRLNLGVIRSEENVLWSFAPHDISMVLAVAGQVPSFVQASGVSILQEGVEDTTTLHMEFQSGLRADITSSWLYPLKEQRFAVVGSDGMAIFSDTRPWAEKLQFFRNKVRWTNGRPVAQAGLSEFIHVEEGEPLREELVHFLQCVADRSRPRTNVDEAIGVLRVLRGGQHSLNESGRKIALNNVVHDSANENFEGVTIHHTAIVDHGVSIGSGSKIWHFSHILPRSRLGADCIIGQNVMIGPDVQIGNRCKIQNNVAVYSGVTLADDVFCGPSMVFTNVLTPRAHIDRKTEFDLTQVGQGATLGANCTIVCGNDIGEYAMVGAGAVVTRSVPPHALMVGNPARQIGWVSKAGERLGPDMVCPRTMDKYDFPTLLQNESALIV